MNGFAPDVMLPTEPAPTVNQSDEPARQSRTESADRGQRLVAVMFFDFFGREERTGNGITLLHRRFGARRRRRGTVAISGPSGGRRRKRAVLIVIIAGNVRLLRESGRRATNALFGGSRFVDRLDDAEIMFGMLHVVFCRNPVAAGLGITRKGLIFFMHLPGVAANPEVAAVAVERLMPQRSRRARPVATAATAAAYIAAAVTAAAAITITTTAAAIATTVIMMTTAGPSAVRTLSHDFLPFLVASIINALRRLAALSVLVFLQVKDKLSKQREPLRSLSIISAASIAMSAILSGLQDAHNSFFMGREISAQQEIS